jgi:hypothetical protein
MVVPTVALTVVPTPVLLYEQQIAPQQFVAGAVHYDRAALALNSCALDA